jgi:hypothetical protein
MTRNTVPVTVEWAYWGKESKDVGYRLLRCSDGTFNATTFDHILTRYALGTPPELPQVAISWQFDQKQQRNYLALAIYEAPPPGAHDARGRNFITCRCFCVPYAELAAGPVSYLAMYQAFREIRIPVTDRGLIETRLPVLQSSADLDPLAKRLDPLARRTAAMLLTCKPVCISEAHEIGCDERLLFLDSVMSLLPYGLRSRVSASTWVSRIFEEHKFRLFFSSGCRKGDYEVAWGPESAFMPSTSDVEANYLSWIYNDARDPVAQTAKLTVPIEEFNRDEVGQMMKQLYAHQGRLLRISSFRRTHPYKTLPKALTKSSALPADPVVDDEETASIATLLVECDDMINGGARSLIELAINRLSDRRDRQVTTEQRQEHQQIITERQLFREYDQLGETLQTKLYHALLQLAFGAPLTYEGYCQLEGCLGITPGKPIHRPLLQAIDSGEIGGLSVRLLVLKGIGGTELKEAFRPDHENFAELIETAAADWRLLPQHAELIYHAVVWDLLDQFGQLDRQVLQPILHSQGYLAPTLARLHQDKAGQQWTELRRLLRFAYGGRLDAPAIRDILGRTASAPTDDLLFAVLSMAERKDAELAERTFIRSLATKRGYPIRARDQALEWLPDKTHPDAESGSLPAAPRGTSVWNVKRNLTSWRDVRRTSGHPLQAGSQLLQPSDNASYPGSASAPMVQNLDEAREALSRLEPQGGKHAGGEAQTRANRAAHFKKDIRNNLGFVFLLVFAVVVICVLIVVIATSHATVR